MPQGGPDGGDGGDGGSVDIIGNPEVNTLLSFRYKRRFVAGDGGDGMGGVKHGKNAMDLAIAVPVGTLLWSDSDSRHLVADLEFPGQSVRVAVGGRGGRGNTHFASSTNRFPLLAEEGEPGEKVSLRLELKLLADVGIIGAPSVGKSSLLAAVSAARPKIAGYPFTTLEPVLGVVERGDKSFVMVDVPGLIEGAHRGVGLGHDFLRHIERTRVLVHIVDGSSEDAVSEANQVTAELELFNPDILQKGRIIAVNKIDVPGVRARVNDLSLQVSGGGIGMHLISAATGEGVDGLLDHVLQVLAATGWSQLGDQSMPAEHPIAVLRPRGRNEPAKVAVQDGVYVVDMPAAARIAAMVHTGDWNARMQFYGQLRRMGVVKALEHAGISVGDPVRIGDVEWAWE